MQKARTEIYIRRKNTDDRTHKIERKHIRQENKIKRTITYID
jgi:hypothetical protein